jgi:hypothetical protein
MSSNDKGKNIVNAFKVVYETYANVQKLMSYLKSQAEERKEYVCCSDRFLRWRSDGDSSGWLYGSITNVFQNAQDDELENTWRDGPLYVYELNFGDYDEAMVNIVRFDYEGIENWNGSSLSPGDHWIFWWPLYDPKGNIMDHEQNGNEYRGSVKSDEMSKRYRGIKSMKGFSVPLVEITAENACDTIFGGFSRLADNS